MKRFLFGLLLFVLSFSLVRYFLGLPVLTLSSFLNILSQVDFSFSSTFETFMSFSAIFDIDSALGAWDSWIAFWDGLGALMELPIAIIKDLWKFCVSVGQLVMLLFGQA